MSPQPEHDFVRYRDHGDAEALARVFDALAPKLLLVAQHLTRDGAGAEDLVQATFLAAMRDAPSYDGERSILAWLSGILAHRARDERRRARVRAAEPLGAEADAGDDPLARAADHETVERIGAAIDALDEPYREVLVLRVVHGLAPTEIAHALGRAPGTVRMQLQRGREKLRERLPESLALPALFLADDGPGLGALRARLVREAAPTAAAGAGGGSWLAAKWAAAVLLGLGLGGWWWSARDGRSPREAESVAAAPSVRPAESTPELAAAPTTDQGSAREAVRSPAPPAEGAAESSATLVAVKGQVLTLEGAPLAGAEIQAVEPGSGGLGRTVARSGSDGSFAVEVLPGTLLVARRSGLQPSNNKRTRLRARPGETAVVVLVMGADGHALSGSVSDEHGVPVPAARVAVLVDEDARKKREGLPVPRKPNASKALDREAFVLVADDEGRFTTSEAPAGGAVLLARAADPDDGRVGIARVDVEAGADNRVEVALGPGAALLGRVSDERGRASAGLRVAAEWKGELTLGALDDHDWGPAFADREAVTAADGRFELRGLLPGRHDVRVLAGEHELTSQRFELAAGERRVWDVEVSTTVVLTVQALDPDGQPLAGWGLAWGAGDELDHELERTLDMPATLDGEGRHRIDSLELTEHVFALYAPADPGRGRRFPKLPCAVRRGVVPGAETLELRLERAELASGRIAGTWLDARGAPCAHFEVALERTDLAGSWDVDLAGTDEAGRFEFAGLAAGEYRVLADEDDVYPRRTLLAECTLEPGAARDLGTLSLEDATRLLVDLEGEDGEPIGVVDGRVTALESGASTALLYSPRTRTLQSEPLMPGEHLLYAAAVGYAPSCERVRLAPGPENRLRVVLRRGIDVELRVVLPPVAGPAEREARPGRGRVQLDLADAEGRPALDLRLDAPWLAGRTREIALKVRLVPGSYAGELVDHTTDPGPSPRRSAEVRFEVPEHGLREPIRVVIP